MRIPKRLVPALLAVTTPLGSMAALAQEPNPEKPDKVQASGAANAPGRTNWSCHTVMDGVFRGTVLIWWGHTSGDATWACNEWISACGSAHGGCYATPKN